MKKIFILFAIISFFLIDAQIVPSIEWQKSLGGSKDDYVASIQQTIDNGFIVAGGSNSTDGDLIGHHGTSAYSDYWIVKLENDGIIEWQKSLGGTKDDRPTSIQQTKDNGYIVIGSSNSNDGDVSENKGGYDYWIAKLDNSGSIEWQKSLGGSNDDYATSINQTTEGGYIISGYSNSNDGDVNGHIGDITQSNYWIVKVDNNGNIQWQKSLGGNYPDYAYCIKQTTDTGYIVTGGSLGDVNSNQTDYDYWTLKLDKNGNVEWQKSLGGSGYDIPYFVQQTTDLGYITVGKSYSTDKDVTGHHGTSMSSDYWVVKINSIGNIQWQKSLGGTNDDVAYSVQQTTDGGYIVVGYSNSNDGDVSENKGVYDSWILKLDISGNIQWQKSMGGSFSDFTYSVYQTKDGGYILAGGSKSNDGDVSGHFGTSDYSDYWIIKLSSEELTTQEILSPQIKVYPNPTKDILNFSQEVENIKIKDLSGKILNQISNSEKTINISKLAKGTYIISAITKTGETVNKKFIKE